MENNNYNFLTLDSIRNTLTDRYNAFRNDWGNQENITEELINDLNEFVNHFLFWIKDQKRVISNSAKTCVTRFVQAELDITTIGKRGMGRLTENFPRFGAQYKNILGKSDDDTLDKIKILFSNHLLCGYLFAEYIFYYGSHIEISRNLDMESSDHLLKHWVPLIFSEDGIPAFDRGMESKMGKSYSFLKRIWIGAYFDEIFEILKKLNIERNDYLDSTVLNYFNAGIVLRLVEYSPPRKISQF